MNPILLKPKGDHVSQVVMLGRPHGDMHAGAYWQSGFDDALGVVKAALDRLRSRYDLVIMEGAGSPAEMNLLHRDLGNMRAAEMADAPVLLVGDIERGGIFASLLGTLWLLPKGQRDRVIGLIVNKFRGDMDLFAPGRAWLEHESGLPVFGVLPWFPLEIAAEDSLSLPAVHHSQAGPITIAVIRHPHIANFTDFDALCQTPGVTVRFAVKAHDLEDADAVILPGSKNTIDDLHWLKQSGLDRTVLQARRRGAAVIGLCGGLQMLGMSLEDPLGLEGTKPGTAAGLDLVPMTTRFLEGKITHLADGEITAADPDFSGLSVHGYEVHSGVSEPIGPGVTSFIRVKRRSSQAVDIDDGVYLGPELWGSYFHGIFDNDRFRLAFINRLRRRRGLPPLALEDVRRPLATKVYDALADALAQHLDLAALERLAGVRRS